MTAATQNPINAALQARLPIAFAAAAFAYMALDASGLRGPWMASLKIVPIAILAAVAMQRLTGLTRTLSLIALTLSALGDLLLALDFPNQFTFGLGAFLLAQLTYTANFLRGARLNDWGRRRSALRGVPLLLAAWLLARLIVPQAGELAPAVLAYLLVITGMALSAAAHRGNSALLFAGAVTFMVSDALIALNRFVTPIPMAGTAIMLSYYAAQAMLLYGVGRAKA